MLLQIKIQNIILVDMEKKERQFRKTKNRILISKFLLLSLGGGRRGKKEEGGRNWGLGEKQRIRCKRIRARREKSIGLLLSKNSLAFSFPKWRIPSQWIILSLHVKLLFQKHHLYKLISSEFMLLSYICLKAELSAFWGSFH